MLEHIENMRSKPEHIRKRYSFIVSFSISSLIFVGWIASYGLHKSPVISDSSNSKVEAPASALTASVSGLFDDLKNMFSGTNKVEYSSQIEVKGGKR